MKKMIILCVSAFLTNSLWISSTFAQDEKKLTYPELEVTPRASERLRMEAEKERKHQWAQHIPLQLSALTTLAAGLSSRTDYPDDATDKKKDDLKWASDTAVGVGALWLGISFWLSSSYRPYLRGWSEVSKLPQGKEREQLVRERLAEEALERPSDLAWRLQMLSFLTNAGASAYLISTGNDQAKLMGGVAAAMSFAPILFNYRWQAVYQQHRLYKKKIYGPVAHLSLLASQNKLIPGMVLALSF